MSAMPEQNIDSLLTKDYLDKRFAESEAWFERKLDQSFAQIDQRFDALESRLGVGSVGLGRSQDQGFANIDRHFNRIELKLWLILALSLPPALQTVYGWLT